MKRSLGLGSLVGLLAMLTACVSAGTVPDEQAQASRLTGDLLIENVTLIDAENGQRGNMDVLLSQGLVQSVGEDLTAEAAQTIDGTGKFLIPGLWDAHVHLAFESGIDHRVFFPLSLAHGITYLRDTGGQLDQLSEARVEAANNPLTPDLYVSGPLIDGEPRVYDGNGRANLSVGVKTAEEAAAMVDQLADQGADFIKTYEMLTPEAFAGAVKRARARGLSVTGHVPLSMRARQAASGGLEDMQHLRNLELDCVADGDGLLQARVQMLANPNALSGSALRSAIHSAQRIDAIRAEDDAACSELIAVLAANKVAQTPTLALSRLFNRLQFGQDNWQQSYGLMPQEIAKTWRDLTGAIGTRQPSADSLLFDQWLFSMAGRLHDSGVPFMAGTDAPIGFLAPGFSLHEELAMLVEAGLSPMEVLRAATITPAAFFGLEGQQGTIAPGMLADMVLLGANPLEDIRNTAKIEAVVRKGRYLNASDLTAMKSAVANIE